MTSKTYLKTVLLLSLGGTLFAGYLSGVKLFSKTCAFGESCPYFMGYPSCYYGFAMFFAMLVVSLAGLFGKLAARAAAKAEAWISFAGILFAGYFTVDEVVAKLSGAGTKYALLLPTCAYGLLFYFAIFVLSASFLRDKKNAS